MASHAVGVRELRQRASALLRRVEGGETIRITDRGRFVALLCPAPTAEESPLATLRAKGETIFEGGSLDDVGEPLDVRGKDPASRVLRKLRARER
jgi:prevent-host-death family protein